MKYAIRLIGSSDFLSSVTEQGICKFVHGWDNPCMILYSSEKAAQPGLDATEADGIHSMVEEMSEFA